MPGSEDPMLWGSPLLIMYEPDHDPSLFLRTIDVLVTVSPSTVSFEKLMILSFIVVIVRKGV